MTEQQQLDYERIARAIDYLQTNFKNQPSLDEIANAVNLSPFHFQRLFTDWAGTSPKKFLQYISLDHAKMILKEGQSTIFDTAFETGLSSTSRLHDLFVNIEGMTPNAYKNGGKGLSIKYQFAMSPFGKILIASTDKGICYLSFYEDEQAAFAELKAYFPNADFVSQSDEMQTSALQFFQQNLRERHEIKLHLKGTPFQLKVWEALLKIPSGQLSTYGSIATEIEKPSASRAVGTAIGRNPIAFLIPCHRVIQSSGKLSGYRWGSTRKTAIIGWEAANLNG